MSSWDGTGKLIEEYKLELSWNGEKWFATSYIPGSDDPTCWHIGESQGFSPCGCAFDNPHDAVEMAVQLLLDETK